LVITLLGWAGQDGRKKGKKEGRKEGRKKDGQK
jgi:hypothetical protein